MNTFSSGSPGTAFLRLPMAGKTVMLAAAAAAVAAVTLATLLSGAPGSSSKLA